MKGLTPGLRVIGEVIEESFSNDDFLDFFFDLTAVVAKPGM